MPYIGTQPKDVRSFGRAKFDFTATQGQTAFTGADDDSKTLGFTDGQIEVYVNGILMDDSDFTTSNGNTVTLASAANLNDIISIVALQTDIPNSDYVPASGGTFTGETIHNQNVLVGKTVSDGALTGHELRPSSFAVHTVDGGAALYARRMTDNGDIMVLQGNSGTVGSVGIESSGLTIDGEPGHAGIRFAGNELSPRDNGADADGVVSLGESDKRWKDLYLSGGVYLGGTGAANHLDDYEEGTWSPVICDLGGNDATMSSQNGKYIKVGSLVMANFGCTISSKGSMTGNYLFVRTLPFAHAGSNAGTGMINRFANLSTSYSSIGLELGGGVVSYAWFTGMSGTSGTADGYLPPSHINSNFFIQGTVVYTIV